MLVLGLKSNLGFRSAGGSGGVSAATPLAPLYTLPVEVPESASAGDVVATFTPQPGAESGLPLTMSLSDASGYFELEENGGDYDLKTLVGGMDAGILGSDDAIDAQVNNVNGIRLSPDGTKLYVCSVSGQTIWQYSVTTPHRPDLGVTLDIAKYLSGGSRNNFRDIFWKPDGLKFWVVDRTGSSNSGISQYGVASAFDISDATYEDSYVTSYNNFRGLYWKPDGTGFFISDLGNSVLAFNCLPTWSLSGINTNPSYVLPAGGHHILFSDDGSNLYYSMYTDDNVQKVTLTTPWILSSATTDETLINTTGIENYPTGLSWGEGETTMVVAGLMPQSPLSGNAAVHVYTMPSVSPFEVGQTYPVTVTTTEAGGKTQNEDVTVNVIEAPLWTPEELANVSSWYDAQDASTVTLNGSDDVTEWADKSAGDNPLTPYIAAGLHHEPGINGHEAIVWPVTNNTLALDDDASGGSVNRQAVFMVLKFEDGTSSHWQASGQAGYPGIFGATNTSYHGFHGVHSVDYIGATTPYNNGFWRLNGSDPNQAATFDFLPTGEGQLIYAHATSATNFALRLGMDREFTNRGYRGAIGEVITLSGIPTDEDRQKVEGYLAHKWGLAAKLPSDHPYKSAAPTA